MNSDRLIYRNMSGLKGRAIIPGRTKFRSNPMYLMRGFDIPECVILS